MKQHGTQLEYKHGCRCQECRKAHADYCRDQSANRKARLTSGKRVKVQHGTMGAYRNWGCRCQKCSDANKMNSREWRAKG